MKNILLAFLIIPTVLFAQNDQKANSILEKMNAINSAYTSISAHFDYTLNNQASGVTDTRKGSMALKENNFRVDVGSTIVNGDGQVVWVILTDDKEVQVYDYQEFKEDNEFDPTEIFSGYSKGFKTKFIESSTVKGVKVNVVDLYPENPAKRSFSRIRLSIETATHHLKQADVKGKNGTDFIYLITSFEPDTDVSSALGKFNQAKMESDGLTVEDLR